MSTLLRDRLYQSPAIVLQARDLGEADRIFVVFTPGNGKLSVIAKGARRARSKLGPYLDYYAEVTLNLTRGRDLDVVTGVAAINRYPRLREDLVAYTYASHFAELVRDLTQERQEHHGVYELLGSSLSLLDQGIDPWHIARHFELKLLVALGYRPELFHCVECQRAIEPVPNLLSPSVGGMLCADCGHADPGGILLSVNAQKYLRTLFRSGLAQVIGLRPSASERQQVTQAMLAYLRYVGERDFSSLRDLDAMEATGNPT
jgi:DNA repair protein RecO (recombination protein O)